MLRKVAERHPTVHHQFVQKEALLPPVGPPLFIRSQLLIFRPSVGFPPHS